MTNPPAQTTPPLLHDRYRVTARLGENRLALVFRATDERLNRPVLVHLLRPDLVENEPLRKRFADEAQGLARRTHPALLEVFDSGDIAGRPYMITEDIAGRLLRDALPLPLAEAIQVLRQVVGGVATTISTQTPTPPISSQTIMLTDSGRAILIEPWWLNGQELREELQAYRAPERSGGGPPDERSTVYALGVLGYELIGGTLPNVKGPLPSIYDRLNGFVPSLAAALTLATARDLDTRTATVQAFSRDLAAVESAAEAPTRQLVRPVPALRDSVREARRTITQRRTQPTPAPPPQSAPSASAAPVRNIPPPRPMMPPPQQAFQPPPAYQPPQPAYQQQPPGWAPQQPAQPAMSRDDLRQELRREIRRESRRRGCLNFIGRRLFTLIFLAVLAGGCFWGFTYGRDWLTSGRAKNWACGYIPQFACDFLPGANISEPISYVIAAAGANVRSSPKIEPSNIVVQLPQGTKVVSRDPSNPLNVASGDGQDWILIETEGNFEGRPIKGWIAVNLLQQEGTP